MQASVIRGTSLLKRNPESAALLPATFLFVILRALIEEFFCFCFEESAVELNATSRSFALLRMTKLSLFPRRRE
jgi:hypothetical protein